MNSSPWQVFWDSFAKTSYDHVGLLPQNKQMLEHIALLAGTQNRILDAGCGTGNLTMLLAPKNKVTALDFSLEMLEIAKGKLGHFANIRFVQGDVTNLPFPGHSFEVVTSVNVLFNLKDPRKAIEEAYRSLTPKGHFLISTPAGNADLNLDVVKHVLRDSAANNLNKEKTLHLLEKNRELFCRGGMQFTPSEKEFEELLVGCGFSIKKMNTIYYGMNHFVHALKS